MQDEATVREIMRLSARIKELEERVEKARSLLLDDEWNTSAALRALAGKGDDRG